MSAATCSRVSTKMGPTTNSKVNSVAGDSVPLKLGRQCAGVAKGYGSGRSATTASSESSDPFESDYSEEAEEEEDSKHHSSRGENNYEDIDGDEEENDNEEEDDNDEEEEQDEDDDGNETDDEEDDSTEDNSSVETAKGVRKYSLDDYQIIKTVGKWNMAISLI
uniref:Uncharacterized protein n=1 Tax=Stomoxys calcitrans TaxID=35570 RepID=A0A1I8QD01_STOCA